MDPTAAAGQDSRGDPSVTKIFDHVVLPPKVGPTSPATAATNAECFIDGLLTAMCGLAQLVKDESSAALLSSLRWSLERMQDLYKGGVLYSAFLKSHLSTMNHGQFVVVYLPSQNGTLLIFRSADGESYRIEAFESRTSPETVLSSHALLWTFPTDAVELTRVVFEDDGFLSNLCSLMEQASSEKYAAFTDTTETQRTETETSSAPAFLFNYLMPVLHAVGKPSVVLGLEKKIRDESVFESKVGCWRRNAFYLSLRVGLQRCAIETAGSAGAYLYKNLVAMFLADTATRAIGTSVPTEFVSFACRKLARRLAKIESKWKTVSGEPALEAPSELASVFEQKLISINKYLGERAVKIRAQNMRKIPILPDVPQPHDCELVLQNSKPTLDSILYRQSKPKGEYGGGSSLPAPPKEVAELQLLAEMEDCIEAQLARGYSSITEVVRGLEGYLRQKSGFYTNDSVRESYRLLLIFRLWAELDRLAILEFPLIKEYKPAFTPQLLDCLQLVKFEQLRQLQELQTYLSDRQVQSTDLHLFSDPSPQTFGVRHFDANRGLFQPLMEQIQEANALKEATKKAEWESKLSNYKELNDYILSNCCTCEYQRESCQGSRLSTCKRCKNFEDQKQISILIHERPLPEDVALAKSTVFELIPPANFEVYRDMTVRIMKQVCTEEVGPIKYETKLSSYPGLSSCYKGTGEVRFVASDKSFSRRFHCDLQFPIAFDTVIRRNPFKWKYEHASFGIYLGTLPEFSLRGYFWEWNKLPKGSPLLTDALEATLKSTKPPSSAVQLVSQAACPQLTSIFEFSAVQDLFVGTKIRWYAILVELFLTNVRTNSETTYTVITRLAFEVGPRSCEDPKDNLRQIHAPFRERLFTEKLVVFLRRKVAAIEDSCYNNHTMALVLIVAVRVAELSEAESCKNSAIEIINRCQNVCEGWALRIHLDLQQKLEPEERTKKSRFAFRAALLARRCFFIAACYNEVSPAQIEGFVSASLILKDNVEADSKKWPAGARSMMADDFQEAHRKGEQIYEAILAFPQSCLNGMKAVLPLDHEYQVVGAIERLKPFGVSINAGSAGRKLSPTNVLFDPVTGTTFIDGVPTGVLPSDYVSTDLLELLGQCTLTVIRSPLPNMDFVLTYRVEGYSIHLGKDSSEGAGGKDRWVKIMLKRGSSVYELVPRSVFRSSKQADDLPERFISNNFHLLEVNESRLEVRPESSRWSSKKAACVIDLQTGQASMRDQSWLVDPRTALAKDIYAIFAGIEEPAHIVITTKKTRKSTSTKVSLPRLSIDFSVQGGLLVCREMKLSITLDQNIGCFFGFSGYLACQSIFGSIPDRYVLVPLGKPSVQKEGEHVRVDISHGNQFVRFRINAELGRLECQPNPEAVFLKVLLHALTSLYAPDSLTGKTGVEAALDELRSAACHPWGADSSPLVAEYMSQLEGITPVRTFHLGKRKSLETVSWNSSLPVLSQVGSFHLLVTEILATAATLSLYDPAGRLPNVSLAEKNRELLKRAERQSSQYSRIPSAVPAYSIAQYVPRAGDSTMKHHVYQIAHFANNVDISLLKTHPMINQKLLQLSSFNGFVRANCISLKSVEDLLSVTSRVSWVKLSSTFMFMMEDDLFTVLFRSALLQFNQEIATGDLKVLIMLALAKCVASIKPPSENGYTNYCRYEAPTSSTFKSMAEIARQSFDRRRVPRMVDESAQQHLRRVNEKIEEHNAVSSSSINKAASVLLKKWMERESVPLLQSSEYKNLDCSQINNQLMDFWPDSQKNRNLKAYVDELEAALSARVGTETPPSLAPYASSDRFSNGHPNGTVPRLRDLLLNKERFRQPVGSTYQPVPPPSVDVPRNPTAIESLVDQLHLSNSAVRKKYAHNLMQSCAAFRKQSTVPKTSQENVADFCSTNLELSLGECGQIWTALSQALKHKNSRQKWFLLGGLWPCLTPVQLLGELSGANPDSLPANSRKSLTAFGVAVTQLQRFKRLDQAIALKRSNIITSEVENQGHSNWDPEHHPEWLLIEIDSNIMIRPLQVDVANEMVNPSSGNNTVLQLNMGEGKTSVIIPMVASALANGKQLTRVIVPRSLLLQTARILQERLGRMCNRKVAHVPFSRSTSLEGDRMSVLAGLYKTGMEDRTVFICLPENLLSFKLCTLQRAFDSSPLATPMAQLGDWLRAHGRDVLDECDDTLAVNSQLVYTSGTNLIMPGHPNRWRIIEELLLGLLDLLPDIQDDFPESVEVTYRDKGDYPFITFLNKDAEQALVRRLAADVCARRIHIIPTPDHGQIDNDDLQALGKFLVDSHVDEETYKTVDRYLELNAKASEPIFLLRGLFSQNILIHCLNKRWNVQYGLHPGRDPMSVPFQAKGVPSEKSEWGHPDVSLLYTCLSFYYGGLNLGQFSQSIHHISKLDDPRMAYNLWIEHAQLPERLSVWEDIQLWDIQMIEDIWSHLRYTTTVVNYFLNTFVFPRYAKQYQYKISASPWDLIQTPFSGSSTTGAEAHPITTGFSGTNDNRDLLPLTIKQIDLPNLFHTNAEVIGYLLEARNSRVICQPTRSDERGLIDILVKDDIDVLIDVGAHVLEMDNLSFVQEWVAADPRPNVSALYFNEDAPFIFTKGKGKNQVASLFASRFAESLEGCLVYYDQAHTRGTDLPLFLKSKGALTLGKELTKDQTVQAAMRLRQLASTQSVCFVSPLEVTNSIRNTISEGPVRFNSSHVIRWLLEQTCKGLEAFQGLYYVQGRDFCTKIYAQLTNGQYTQERSRLAAVKRANLHKEPVTIRELYDPRNFVQPEIDLSQNGYLDQIHNVLYEQRRVSYSAGKAIQGSMLQEVEVEQEHEVQVQVELVRHVEKPVRPTPRKYPGLHEEVIDFMSTGKIVNRSNIIIPMLRELAHHFPDRGIQGSGPQAETRSVYLSHEYFRYTTDANPDMAYIRTLRWVLWSTKTKKAVIITSDEAEDALALLRARAYDDLYLLTYAASIGISMLPDFNRIDFYSIPALPSGWALPLDVVVDIGIVSARTYFEWREYGNVTGALRLPYVSGKGLTVDDPETMWVQDGAGSDGPVPPFPPKFLMEYLSLVRKGRGYTQTPMNYVIHRRQLRADMKYFEQVKRVDSGVFPAAGKKELATRMADISDSDYSDDEMSELEAASCATGYCSLSTNEADWGEQTLLSRPQFGYSSVGWRVDM